MASDLDFITELLDKLGVLESPTLSIDQKLDGIAEMEGFLAKHDRDDLVAACMLLSGMYMTEKKKVRNMRVLLGDD